MWYFILFQLGTWFEDSGSIGQEGNCGICLSSIPLLFIYFWTERLGTYMGQQTK